MSENKPKSKCETCWKSFIWACPLGAEIPKNIVSCSAYEPTDVYLKEQDLISEFWEKIDDIIENSQCSSDYYEELRKLQKEYKKKLNPVIENKDNKSEEIKNDKKNC